jgi:hypothetical protein
MHGCLVGDRSSSQRMRESQGPIDSMFGFYVAFRRVRIAWSVSFGLTWHWELDTHMEQLPGALEGEAVCLSGLLGHVLVLQHVDV